MARNPSDSIILRDRIKQVADEMDVGGHFEGESKRSRLVGRTAEVVVDILKRKKSRMHLGPNAHDYFMRVSLRSVMKPWLITRYEIDIDKYSTERELIGAATLGGGVIAETQIENHNDKWDPDFVAKQAAEAMRELLVDLKQYGE